MSTNDDQSTELKNDSKSPDLLDEGQWYSNRPHQGTPGKRMKIILGLLLFVILVTGVVLWIRRSRESAAAKEQAAQPIVGVSVAKAERKAISEKVSAVGTIFPRDQAVVSAKISAQIAKMPLLKNRMVKAGDVIATLESRDLRAQRGEAQAALVEAQAGARSVATGTIPVTNAQDEKALRDARATVANARATYNRRKVLFDQGGISKKDLEASELALTTAEDDLKLAQQTVTLRLRSLNPNDRAVAESKVGQAEQHLATVDAQLSYATIRSPITGFVTEQFQYQGEFAASGAKLVTIADTSEVIVKAPVADTVASQLKVGDTATVEPADTPGETMTGKITLISKSSDPANRSVELWINLANGNGKLKANGSAEVTVDAQSTSDAVVVPASAVTLDATNADEGTVMVVDQANVAHETKVKVGIHSGDEFQIVEGLNGGETVVTAGNYALPDKTKVVVNTEADKEGDKPGDEKEKGDDADKKGDKP